MYRICHCLLATVCFLRFVEVNGLEILFFVYDVNYTVYVFCTAVIA